MKREVFPQLIHHDEGAEIKLKAELKSTREALQRLLNCFNGLNLGVCRSLFHLAHDPMGLLTEKNIPVELAVAAREARNAPLTGVVNLWLIEGDEVVVNESLAAEMISKTDIWVTNSQQARFADLCVKYVQVSNELNEQLRSIQTMRMPAVPWVMTGHVFPWIFTLELLPDQLQLILKDM